MNYRMNGYGKNNSGKFDDDIITRKKKNKNIGKKNVNVSLKEI